MDRDEIEYGPEEMDVGPARSRSKMPGALGKKYGPLSLGMWIVVVLGGLALAWMLKKMMGTGGGTVTTDFGYAGLPAQGVADPLPVTDVEPMEPYEPSYMEVFLQWPDEMLQIEQQPIEITMPEGIAISTPVPITVDVPELEGVGTNSEVAALRARLAVLISQRAALVARLNVARAEHQANPSPATRAALQELQAKRADFDDKIARVRRRIRNLLGGTSTVGSGSDSEASSPTIPLPF